ncbi:MAG: DUF1501 domain-containing protein [Planctomycetota bacterium]
MSESKNTVSNPSRREFLEGAISAASAGVFTPGLLAGLGTCTELDPALPADGERPGRILVVVELSGGNDGLNTLVPYEDDAYYKARRRIAIKKAQVIKLDERIGLHPSLRGLKELWDRGELALVEGVGYPEPNRSHFHAMDIWQTADPEISVVRSGWLGRAMEHLYTGAAAPGLALVGRMPVAMLAQRVRAPSIGSLAQFAVRLDPRSLQDGKLERRLLRQNLTESRGDGSATERVRRAFLASVDESRRLRTMARAYRASAPYPRGLGDRLKLVAQLVEGGHPAKVYYTRTGGYDTHGGQLGTQARLHAAFGSSVAAFFADLRAKKLDRHVTVMAYSEFGRRVHENASQGTDHGTAGPVVLAGPSVRGGFHGKAPSLSDLDRGDLKFTTDFRRIYAALLRDWLRVSPGQVLGGDFAPLDLLRGRFA